MLRLFGIWSDVEGYMREELDTVMAGNVMVTLFAFITFFIAQKHQTRASSPPVSRADASRRRV